jgi:hypothetical protein
MDCYICTPSANYAKLGSMCGEVAVADIVLRLG